MTESALQRISLVIPVYRGEQSLPTLMAEILPLTTEQATPSGSHRFVISEVLLVHDCGPDESHQLCFGPTRPVHQSIGNGLY